MGCQTCGGFGDRHDPIAHGIWQGEEFVAEELCRCGHEHHRHDMGHGCIECRCRRFSEGQS